MYGSPTAATAKELNLTFSSTAAAFGRRKEESDLQRQQQMASGLLRYRSAPSTLLGEVCEDFLPARPSSPETESMFARFLTPDPREESRDKTAAAAAASGGGGHRNQLYTSLAAVEQTCGFTTAPPQMLYHSQQQQPQPPVADGANLVRQSSSPAGFFSHLNADSGYGLMRGITAGIRNGMAADTGRLKGQISFSSRQNSLSQISEMGSDGVSGGGGSPEECSNGRCFFPSYPVSSWEDSLLSDNFSGFKRAREAVGLNSAELKNGELKNQHHVSGLTHQFSLPKTSSEMAAIEKFLQFQDSVPCKIRAKRGCATHPRSIAERVRRTRISERMRKLQELVPNMDKQTNTADMLDLAVDYIKDLQRQVKSLSDCRAACTCAANNQKPFHENQPI